MTITQTKKIIKGKKPYNGRVYRYPDGVYLSVTSVINPDGLAYPPELLKQYSSRGIIVHDQVEHFLTHYRIANPSEVSDQKDIDNVANGSLKLKVEDCNVLGFFQEFGKYFTIKYVEREVRNTAHKYAGRVDIIGTYKDELAIIDIKTSGNYTPEKKIAYWKQLAAYAHCMTPTPTKLVIIPLNPMTENGYDEPMVEDSVADFFQLFLTDLEAVKQNYIMPLA